MIGDDPLIVGVSLASFAVFTLLTVLVALRQLDRVMRHRLFHGDAPELLIRDLVFFWALVILLVVPSISSVFGETLGDKLWWVVVRSVIGVGALGIWAWYEFIAIGRRSRSKE